MDVYRWSIDEFLAAASSKSHTPGGGSASAVCAAIGASMILKVANLTIGKKGYEDYQEEVRTISRGAENAIFSLKGLTDNDMLAFERLAATWKLPSNTKEEKETKTVGMQKALKEASKVPMEICKTCLLILRLANRLAPIGNKLAISDVGVGVSLAYGALQSAMLSVDINLKSINDEDFKKGLLAERKEIFEQAEELKAQAMETVQGRL